MFGGVRLLVEAAFHCQEIASGGSLSSQQGHTHFRWESFITAGGCSLQVGEFYQ